jgi:hypothetical protein
VKFSCISRSIDREILLCAEASGRYQYHFKNKKPAEGVITLRQALVSYE